MTSGRQSGHGHRLDLRVQAFGPPEAVLRVATKDTGLGGR